MKNVRSGADSDFKILKNSRIGADSDFNFKFIFSDRSGADLFRISEFIRLSEISCNSKLQRISVSPKPENPVSENRIGADSDF